VTEIGVIFGGPSPEHDVSVLTGLQAARELVKSSDFSVRGLYWSKGGEWFEVDPSLEGSDFVDGPPKGSSRLQFMIGPEGGFAVPGRVGRAKPLDLEAVVVCCHGGPGEDGTLQGALDLAGVRHAGPSVAGAALGMDKLAFGSVVRAAGLPSLPRELLVENRIDYGFEGPYIVKPRFGGSSIGIEVVEDLATAQSIRRSSTHLADGAVLEPYRGDLFDLQIAARSWPSTELSAIERPLRTPSGSSSGVSEILGYRDKYAGGEGMASAPREVPAAISSYMDQQIQSAARQICDVCDLSGVMRIDFLSDGESIWVNEINTIPGSLARYLWVEPPIAFKDLLLDLVSEARDRPPRALKTIGADGSILRNASTIAAKLA
jgi:D-alanine-D-alanine ligase